MTSSPDTVFVHSRTKNNKKQEVIMKFIYVVTVLLSLFITLTADAARVPTRAGCSLETWCEGHPWQCRDCITCCDSGATTIEYSPKCVTTCVSHRRRE